MQFTPRRGGHFAPIPFLFGVSAVAWLMIAALLSLQAQIVSAWEGARQQWWPSFGYSVAIFSIWAMLTPALILATQ